MDYSEYRLEREGQRLEDSYVLFYEPKGSPIGTSQQLVPWLAALIKAILVEKCPENVVERSYGWRREKE